MACHVLCVTLLTLGSPLSVEVNTKADLREVYGGPTRAAAPALSLARCNT
jgi:hypothetical protein